MINFTSKKCSNSNKIKFKINFTSVVNQVLSYLSEDVILNKTHCQ